MKRAFIIAGLVIVFVFVGWCVKKFFSTAAAPESEGILLPPIPSSQTGLSKVQPYSTDVKALSQPDGALPVGALPASAPHDNSSPAAEPGGRLRDSSDVAAAVKTLDDVILSKNDNDPRLDADFNALSPEAKRVFRQKYRELSPERRNDRGLIIYLLGKNLTSAEDWAFLRGVESEPPCLSLTDCSTAVKSRNGHRDLGIEVTLAYPQLVALKQAERMLEKARTAAKKEKEQGALSIAEREARSVIQSAKNSRIPAVERAASDLERRF